MPNFLKRRKIAAPAAARVSDYDASAATAPTNSDACSAVVAPYQEREASQESLSFASQLPETELDESLSLPVASVDTHSAEVLDQRPPQTPAAVTSLQYWNIPANIAARYHKLKGIPGMYSCSRR